MQEIIDILQFFGVKKPLFVMSGLAGDDINRFVDREELLKYFIVTIQMRQNCAIVGEPSWNYAKKRAWKIKNKSPWICCEIISSKSIK